MCVICVVFFILITYLSREKLKFIIYRVGQRSLTHIKIQLNKPINSHKIMPLNVNALHDQKFTLDGFKNQF